MAHHGTCRKSCSFQMTFGTTDWRAFASMIIHGPQSASAPHSLIMQTFWQDLRYSLRMLLKRPGFTLTVVGTLALGIGANATIFTWIKAVLLSPLPRLERPDELVEVWGSTRNTSGLPFSSLQYLALRHP